MISILMPAYNAELYLEDCINSILNQSYSDFELLICDDCSTDNTWKIMLGIRDPRIKLFQNKENLGYLRTSNFLVSHATGQYISFQDADDLAAPDRFIKLIKHLVDNNLDLVGSYCGIFFKKNRILSVLKYSTNHDEIIKELSEKSNPPFCGSAVLVKSEVIKRCGLYNDNFDRIGAEDYDWIYRVAIEGFKLGNISEPLYLYRQHNQSVSRLNFEKNKLSLFSSIIAKDLYLSRLNNNNYTFKFLKDKYLKEFELNDDKFYYHVLRLNFFNSRIELFKAFCIFINNVEFSRDKVIYSLYVLFILLFGFSSFEKIKQILR